MSMPDPTGPFHSLARSGTGYIYGWAPGEGFHYGIAGTPLMGSDGRAFAAFNAFNAAVPHEGGSKSVQRIRATLPALARQTVGWAYAKEVLEVAVAKMGPDPIKWILSQYRFNNYIYDTNLLFLDDTIRYLVTGVRQFNVRSWAEMVNRNPARQMGVANSDRHYRALTEYNRMSRAAADAIPGKKIIDGPDLYRTWISRDEDGLVDLVITLDILFGLSALPHGK